MFNKKKVLTLIFISSLILVSIPSMSGKVELKTNSNYQLNQRTLNNDLIFDLKIKLAMKFSKMQSLSACLIKNKTIVWSNNYGFSDKLLLQKPTIKTNYMAGSISKVVTATAIMQLYENESYNFTLDDNVSEWLPFDIKNPAYPNINITFRMLLSHQSSVKGHGINELQYLFSNHPISYIKEILLPNGSEYHPEYWGDYPPGEHANYSNMGFILLGYVIEQMTNQSYEKYVTENILKPLEMKNSSFTLSKIDKKNLAAPYFWFAGIYFRVPKTDFKFIDPPGGMYTTVEDLSHLLIMHLNGGVYKNNRLLKNSTIDMIHKLQYPNSDYHGLRFGLGWMVLSDQNNEPYLQGHAGDLICYHARMFSRISDNTSLIYFYNSGQAPRLLFPKKSSRRIIEGMARINSLFLEKADSL